MLELEKIKNNLTVENKSLNYYIKLSQFDKWLKDNKLQLNRNSIEKYITHLINTNHQETSINIFIGAINYYIYKNKLPIEFFKYLKTKRKILFTFDYNFLKETIIPIVELNFENNPIKYNTLFYFWFFTGLRKSEFLTLYRKHFNLKEQYVIIYASKTKHERYIPFPNLIKEKLINYFNIEEEKTNAFNLTYDHINYIFRKLKQYKELKELTPHSFRRSFATYMLSKGINIFTLKHILGHSNIKTTEIYLNINKNIILNNYNNIIKNINSCI